MDGTMFLITVHKTAQKHGCSVVYDTTQFFVQYKQYSVDPTWCFFLARFCHNCAESDVKY